MMSTAASGIFTSSTLLSNDIYQRFLHPDASDETLTQILADIHGPAWD